MFTISGNVEHNPDARFIEGKSLDGGSLPVKLRTARGILVGLILGSGAWSIIGALIYCWFR